MGDRRMGLKQMGSALLIVGLAMGGTACSRVQGHQGYIVDPVTASAVSPGVDNRQSVLKSLGHPTFAAEFDDNVWYYVSRDTRQYAFSNPKPEKQLVMRIIFDNSGNVTAVDRTGLELVQRVTPNRDKTPTRGVDQSFFDELFGNVGAGRSGSRSNDPTRPQ